jgi:hypothetical protein
MGQENESKGIMFFDSAAVEIPEKIFCGTFKKAGFEAGPFWELAGRVGPPLPPPSLKALTGAGSAKCVCKILSA